MKPFITRIALSVAAALVILAIMVYFVPPKLRQPTPVPDQIPIKWESVAAGYGPIPPGINIEVDPKRLAKGWRIFKNQFDDYKIIYSDEEWELVTDSKDYRFYGPVDPTVVYVPGQELTPEREPWWLYYNIRTQEFRFIYREAKDEGVYSDQTSQDRPGRNAGRLLQRPRRP